MTSSDDEDDDDDDVGMPAKNKNSDRMDESVGVIKCGVVICVLPCFCLLCSSPNSNLYLIGCLNDLEPELKFPKLKLVPLKKYLTCFLCGQI